MKAILQILGLALAGTGVAAQKTELVLEVVDELGNPLPGASAVWRPRDGFFTDLRWVQEEEGEIRLVSEEEAAGFLVLVRAPGRPTRWIEHEWGADPLRRVVLEAGREVELRLLTEDGRALPPGLEPLVVAPELLVDACIGLHLRETTVREPLAMFPASRGSEGSFTVSLPRKCDVHVLVHEPGFLRAFESGPLHVSEETTVLEVRLPAPGSITCSLAPPEAGGADAYDRCGFFLNWIRFDLRATFVVDAPTADAAEIEAAWHDLAPGRYSVTAFTGDAVKALLHQGGFSDQRSFDVTSGSSASHAFLHRPPDDLSGEHSVRLVVVRTTGEPAAGLDFQVACEDPHYGERVLETGTLGPDGSVELSGLPGGPGVAPLQLQVAGARLEDLRLDAGVAHGEVSVRLPPIAGDEAPDLALLDLATREPVRLSSLRGQVVFLDFWATWCGPCQEPLAHAEAVARRRAADWRGRARLVALSLDDDPETLAAHVRDRSWNALLHLWCDEPDVGFGARAALAYGVRAVPTAFLVGADGRITWRGHPGSLDVERAVDELLAGGR